jgi:hypothetical protein
MVRTKQTVSQGMLWYAHTISCDKMLMACKGYRHRSSALVHTKLYWTNGAHMALTTIELTTPAFIFAMLNTS